MLIQNYSSPSGRNSSSQAFRTYRPVVKAYLRSFVPTVSSLLSGVIERQQVSDIPSMEAQIERKGIAEASSDEVLYSQNSEYRSLNEFSLVGKYRLSEDIYVSENEDGVRTHYCPLNKHRDGKKDKDEDFSKKMDQHASWMLDSSSLRSEDIPYLMAEKPSESENEENEGSDIDASTSMIYPPIQNQQSSIDDDSSQQSLLQKGKTTPSFRKLDENIMTAWADDSSDDSEYGVYDENELEMLKYVVGDESDMEEFYETIPVEIDKEKSQSLDNDKNIESILKNDKFLKSAEGEERDPNYPSEHSERMEYCEKSVDENEQRTSDTEPTSTSNQPPSEMENKKGGENASNGGHNLQLTEDQRQIESLEAVVENAILTASIKLNALSEIQKTPWNISSDVTEEIVDDKVVGRLTIVEDSNKMNAGILEGENTTSDVGKCEEKSNLPDVESFSKTGKKAADDTAGFCPQPETAAITNKLKQPNGQKQSNEQKEGFLSMEPVAMNLKKSLKAEETQPDLATALRFMTEVYHTKEEDEMYSDTLSNMDVLDEVPLREMPKTSVTFDDYQGIRDVNPTETFINLKSPCKSSSFEPEVITEETRTEIRPRNKLTKFFKSFKKKLAKKV